MARQIQDWKRGQPEIYAELVGDEVTLIAMGGDTDGRNTLEALYERLKMSELGANLVRNYNSDGTALIIDFSRQVAGRQQAQGGHE